MVIVVTAVLSPDVMSEQRTDGEHLDDRSMGEIRRRGLMLVISSPSGAGKTTLARLLLQSDPAVTMSVSVTTRAKRPSEANGVDYVFVDPATFERMKRDDEFLEHAEVFGHHYGTPRRPVLDALESGRDMLFDIDWQGTQQLASKAREDLVSIFILPPSMAELERRLRARAQDPEPVVVRRMSKAANEISHWKEYDHVLVNHDVDVCLRQIQSILEAQRLRRERQPGLAGFVRTLLGHD